MSAARDARIRARLLGLINVLIAGIQEIIEEEARPNDLLSFAEDVASDDVATNEYVLVPASDPEFEVLPIDVSLLYMDMESRQSEEVVDTKQELGCEEECSGDDRIGPAASPKAFDPPESGPPETVEECKARQEKVGQTTQNGTTTPPLSPSSDDEWLWEDHCSSDSSCCRCGCIEERCNPRWTPSVSSQHSDIDDQARLWEDHRSDDSSCCCDGCIEERCNWSPYRTPSLSSQDSVATASSDSSSNNPWHDLLEVPQQCPRMQQAEKDWLERGGSPYEILRFDFGLPCTCSRHHLAPCPKQESYLLTLD